MILWLFIVRRDRPPTPSALTIDPETPTMRVILFRHGPAGRRDPARWPDDAVRPLTRRGIERTEAAASGLARFLTDDALVLTSPLERAHATAEILRDTAELEAPLETLEALMPGGSYRAVLARLATAGSASCLVLVGHEPELGKLAGMLLFGAPARSLPLKKSGACIIEFTGELAAGAGRLHAFLPPRLLRRLAARSKV